MRILVLGNGGQVGWESMRALAPLGEVIGLDYPDVDFTRPEQLARQVSEIRPQVIYNAVAYTAVDQAEREPERARVINAAAAGALAKTAVKLGAVMVHFSTDYVFDGEKGCAYQELDAPNPLNVYGQTKLEGERAVESAGGAYLVLRTAWVYSTRRESFISKVLEWSKDKSSLKVVADQVSNPTWARMLAETVAQLLARAGTDYVDWIAERSGLYHLAGGGYASRLDWAREILNNRPGSSHSVDLVPALTSDFPSPANRPLYSALDCTLFEQTFGLRLPPWQAALRLALEN